jgi:hypothetical protein
MCFGKFCKKISSEIFGRIKIYKLKDTSTTRLVNNYVKILQGK